MNAIIHILYYMICSGRDEIEGIWKKFIIKHELFEMFIWLSYVD